MTESLAGAPAGSPLSRRRFLGAAAAGVVGTAAGSMASACSGSSGPPHVAQLHANGAGRAVGLLRAGSRPFPKRRAGTDMLPKVRHVVIVMMENHSFDNYFGMLGRGDGFSLDSSGNPTNANPAPDGSTVVANHAPSVCQAHADVSQSWTASHTAWNNGKNDGFVRATGPDPMHYFTGEDLPFYYSLARTFPLCDRWFASVMAQTYPNRKFLLAGSAFGLVDDSFPSEVAHPLRANGPTTIFEALDAHGIEWKDYYSDLPSVLLFPYLASASHTGRFVKMNQFFTDAAAGNLPFLTLVEPHYGTGSEENPQDIRNGELFSSQVINAVMKSPVWPDTVLFWLYDEHGGYYDHVPPQPAVPPDDIPPNVPATALEGDHYSYTGFRVPAVVVSPWARAHYVSHVVHDHTSILKFIETKWNLPALSNRDANASNLLDTLDLTASRPPFLTPPNLAAPAGVGAGEVAACTAASAKPSP